MARRRLDVLRNGQAIERHIAEDELTETANLDLNDACSLASAWVSSLGREIGVRILLVKGPSLAHHGLRRARTSGDVDVLVDPLRFDEFCVALDAYGWRQRSFTQVGTIWAAHSKTYLHDDWPCDIDVHRYFPGFLGDPQAAFDILWRDRESMDVAHREIAIPSRNASILIMILHQLRDGPSRANESELAQLASATLTDADRRGLVVLAQATGAIEPARDMLIRLGISRAEMPRQVLTAEAIDWRARVEADSSGAYFWLLLLRRAPFGARAGLLMRALWPPRSDLLINHPGMTDTPIGRLGARAARIPNGLRGVPRAIRALRRR